MDSKAKKKLDLLQRRLDKLRQQLSGAVKQNDDPQDVVRLRGEVEAAEAEVRRLKES
ncbi:MAG: hypothetical protein ACYC61_07055 [Isosphaeraceae bacterium]